MVNARPAGNGRGGPPVRVAMVGLGWAARSIWLPRLRRHPAFVVRALVDPDPAARAALAGEGTGALVLSSVEELGADLVDLAIVAVPNHLHRPVGCRLLANGVPVFVEKPVCLSSGEADQLAAAERAGGTVLLAGSAARYRADVRALCGLVEALGRVRHVELAWVRARGVPEAGGWFTRRRLAGGGALVDLGWHLLDTATLLLGPVGFDQVAGTVSDDFVNDGSRRAAWRQDRPVAGRPGELGRGGDVEDTARAFLVTHDGVSVSLRASWASHEARDLTLVKVDGSAGSATLRCTFGFSPNRQDGSVLTHTRAGDSAAVPLPDEPVGTEYQRQLDRLPALLADPAGRGGAIQEARQIIGVIERVYDSARRARARRQPAPALHAGR
jgi:oxidoreductase